MDFIFVTNDPEGDNDLFIKIDWGDGEITDWLGPYDSGEEAVHSHSWDEEGFYEIKAKSMDFWDDSRWTIDGYDVRIGNQAPYPPTIEGKRYGDPYEVLTYTFTAEDYEGENVKYVIDWDDGSTDETEYYTSETPVEVSQL